MFSNQKLETYSSVLETYYSVLIVNNPTRYLYVTVNDGISVCSTYSTRIIKSQKLHHFSLML